MDEKISILSYCTEILVLIRKCCSLQRETYTRNTQQRWAGGVEAKNSTGFVVFVCVLFNWKTVSFTAMLYACQ